MGRSKKKKFSQSNPDENKLIRLSEPREGTIRYRFSIFDHGLVLPDTGNANARDAICVNTIMSALKSYEQNTWEETIRNRHHDHFIKKDRLAPFALERLTEINLDDAESFFRLRCNGSQRLWGIRKDDTFYVLWWDPYHQIC